jgi:hypothetical protein
MKRLNIAKTPNIENAQLSVTGPISFSELLSVDQVDTPHGPMELVTQLPLYDIAAPNDNTAAELGYFKLGKLHVPIMFWHGGIYTYAVVPPNNVIYTARGGVRAVYQLDIDTDAMINKVVQYRQQVGADVPSWMVP